MYVPGVAQHGERRGQATRHPRGKSADPALQGLPGLPDLHPSGARLHGRPRLLGQAVTSRCVFASLGDAML